MLKKILFFTSFFVFTFILISCPSSHGSNGFTAPVFPKLDLGVLLPPNDFYLNVTETTGSVRLAMGLGEVLEANLWTPAFGIKDELYFFYFYAEEGIKYTLNWEMLDFCSKHNGKQNYTANIEVYGIYSPDLNRLSNWYYINADGYTTNRTFSLPYSTYVLIPIEVVGSSQLEQGSFAIRVNDPRNPEARTKFSWYLDGEQIEDADDYEYILDTTELNSDKHRVTVIASRDDVVESAEYVYVKE